MKRFGLEGSLKQPQVTGLPDTGTDANESACPFDLESPVMVWDTGVEFDLKPGRLIGKDRHALLACLSEKDCWELRARFSDLIVEVMGDPEAVTLSAQIACAKELKCPLEIVEGNGRIIEEYIL